MADHTSLVTHPKRIVGGGAQGSASKKVEVYLLACSSVNIWSSGKVGALDLNTEMQLWTRAGRVRINLQEVWMPGSWTG